MSKTDVLRKVKVVANLLDNYLDINRPSKHESRLYCIPTSATHLQRTLSDLRYFIQDLPDDLYRPEIANSILYILQESLPILQTSLRAPDRRGDDSGHESPSGRFRNIRKDRQERRQQRNKDEKTCEEINRINADLKHHIELINHDQQMSSPQQPLRRPAELPASTMRPIELPSRRQTRSATHGKLPSSPPPPYASCAGDSTDQDDDVLELNDADTQHDGRPLPRPTVSSETWRDPIMKACQGLMQKRFSTASAAMFADYMTYRNHIRQKSDYRWYLNFRYGSLTLQPDLPAQVFLVTLVPSTHHTHSLRALAYLFEDCLVFANAPFVLDLPRPDHKGDSRDIPARLEGGLALLQQHTVRFAFVQQAAKLDGKVLELRITPNSESDDTMQQTRTIQFQATCQRAKVFEAIRPWLASEVPVADRHHHDSRRKAHSQVDLIHENNHQQGHHHHRHGHGKSSATSCDHHHHSHS